MADHRHVPEETPERTFVCRDCGEPLDDGATRPLEVWSLAYIEPASRFPVVSVHATELEAYERLRQAAMQVHGSSGVDQMSTARLAEYLALDMFWFFEITTHSVPGV